jgi:hypothetical protein
MAGLLSGMLTCRGCGCEWRGTWLTSAGQEPQVCPQCQHITLAAWPGWYDLPDPR